VAKGLRFAAARLSRNFLLDNHILHDRMQILQPRGTAEGFAAQRRPPVQFRITRFFSGLL
jgi:hypothetical protein